MKNHFYLFIYVFLTAANVIPPRASADPFDRLDELTARFPGVFDAYTRRKYLIATRAAEWSEDGSNLFLSIEPAPRGPDAGNLPSIEASIIREKDEEITLTVHDMPSVYPPEYAWRVILAETLLRLPTTNKIEVWIDHPNALGDVGRCAELLAQGEPALNAMASLPVLRAAAFFDLSLVGLDEKPRHDGALTAVVTLRPVVRVP